MSTGSGDPAGYAVLQEGSLAVAVAEAAPLETRLSEPHSADPVCSAMSGLKVRRSCSGQERKALEMHGQETCAAAPVPMTLGTLAALSLHRA